MKILFLTSRLPYPPYRGDKLKIWNLMKELSQRHEILLLTFIESDRERRWISPLKAVCKEIHLVQLPAWRSIVNCIAMFWQPKPFQVAYYSSEAMRKKLAEVLDQTQPDIIHTHLIRMAQYTRSMADHIRVLDLTDAVSLYLEGFRETERNPVVRWVIGTELKRMTEYEQAIQDFNRAMVCSEMDRQLLLLRAPLARIELLYNGIDLGIFSRRNSIVKQERRIIFTGNMSYYPNIDGAKFLVGTILPLIRRDLPDVRLWIVGQNPPRQVRALATDHVFVTGFVEDIAAEYLKSEVAVSPIRFGAGTLNKVLEPLALGIPVVTTSIGVQGLELRPNKEIFVADEPKKFADAVIALLKNPSLQRESGHKAMKRVRARFGWNRIAKDLEVIYNDALRSRVDRRKTKKANTRLA